MVADHYAWEFIRALCDEIADLVFKTLYAEHGALSRALLPKQALYSMVWYHFDYLICHMLTVLYPVRYTRTNI